MPKAKYLDENFSSLLDEIKIELRYMHMQDLIENAKYNDPMLKGVANQLSRWPNHLFSSFIAASFLTSILVLLVIMATLSSPIATDDNCCESKIYEDERFSNIYFVKEAAQLWSRKEFCYIEAAARQQPDLNVYLVNLIRTSDVSSVMEAPLKIALATQNTNIHIADLKIDEFFSRSRLSKVAKNLSNRLLLMAAKAYLLWNSPGIAMHPSVYCNLPTINTSRWNKEGKQDCAPNQFATIDPMIDLQATEVRCQTFLGFLMQEISRNVTQIYSLKDVLDRYCPRIDNCPEVRVLDLKSRCSVNVSDCPTMYTLGNF